MMNFLRKYQYHIFIFTTVVFLLGTFAGFGGYFFGGKGSPNDSIADVDGEKIPLRKFEIQYDRAMTNVPAGTKLDQNAQNQKRDEALRDVIQQMVFDREAKKFGVQVPDQQVAGILANTPAFQTNGAFDPQKYMQLLQSQRITVGEFEEEQRSNIAFNKLRWMLQSVIRVTDKEAELAWATDHKGSMAGYAKGEKAFRDKLWQEKVVYCFNQWFGQIGQRTKVKTHLEILQGNAG